MDPEVQREECEVVLVGAVDAALRVGFGYRELVLRPPFPAAKAESRSGHVKIDPRCASDRGVSRSVVDLPERGDSGGRALTGTSFPLEAAVIAKVNERPNQPMLFPL